MLWSVSRVMIQKGKTMTWLPENARAANKTAAHSYLVSYLASNGTSRYYICGEDEANWYRKIFHV